MRIPDGVLSDELASDIDVVTRKSGLTPWHARLLRALESVANYYAKLDNPGPAYRPKGAKDA